MVLFVHAEKATEPDHRVDNVVRQLVEHDVLNLADFLASRILDAGANYFLGANDLGMAGCGSHVDASIGGLNRDAMVGTAASRTHQRKALRPVRPRATLRRSGVYKVQRRGAHWIPCKPARVLTRNSPEFP